MQARVELVTVCLGESFTLTPLAILATTPGGAGVPIQFSVDKIFFIATLYIKFLNKTGNE